MKYCNALTVADTQVSISPNGRVKENTFATVTCLKPKRYALIGERRIMCKSDGSWSHDEHECRKTGNVMLISGIRNIKINQVFSILYDL